MGGKSSKTLKNKDLKEIGERANREEPNTFHYSNTIRKRKTQKRRKKKKRNL